MTFVKDNKLMARKGKYLPLVGVLLFLMLFMMIDLDVLIIVIKKVDLTIYIAAVLLSLPILLIRAFRWQLLLIDKDIKYDFNSVFASYLIGIFIGLFTPGRAGELARVFFVTNDCGVSTGRAFPSVLIDRLFDLSVILAVGLIALIDFTADNHFSSIMAIILLVVLCSLSMIFIIHPKAKLILQNIVKWLIRNKYWAAKVSSFVDDMHQSIILLKKQTLVRSIGLTLLSYAIFFMQCFLIAMSLGLQITLVEISYALSLATLVAFLPISISGIGTRDIMLISYMASLSISTEQALGFSILFLGAFHVFAAITGLMAICVRTYIQEKPFLI